MYELRKRRIARQGDVVIMDKGFYAYRDHVSKEYLDVQRLNGMHRYPLDIFSSKSLKEEERRFRNLKAKLMSLLRSWQEFKPVRAVIEDVFKLAKSFGLRRLHRYTRRS
ncbi:transposase, partial [Archaeoglobus sp.]